MGKILSETHAGPDDPIYKGGLRVSSVLGSSALTKSSPTGTDGASPVSAPDDSMRPMADALERHLMEFASKEP